MRPDCRGAKVASLDAIGRGMMCSDHAKQAGPFASDGEQGWTGLLHHHLARRHAGGGVWHQQETKARCSRPSELGSTRDKKLNHTTDVAVVQIGFLSVAERARSRVSFLHVG